MSQVKSCAELLPDFLSELEKRHRMTPEERQSWFTEQCANRVRQMEELWPDIISFLEELAHCSIMDARAEEYRQDLSEEKRVLTIKMKRIRNEFRDFPVAICQEKEDNKKPPAALTTGG